MKIEVNFTAQLKKEAGCAMDLIELEDGKLLMELVQILRRRYSEGFDKILFEDNQEYRPSSLLVLNGMQVLPSEVTPLKDGDVVTIMSPIAGG